MTKFLNNIQRINIFIIYFFLINSITSVLVKAGEQLSCSCNRNIYYVLIDVIFTEKPEEEYYPFNLKLADKARTNFKCMLDYNKSKIYCFHSFSDDNDFIEKSTQFQFPYPFPNIEGIEFDYDSFLQKVYIKVWNVNDVCGNEDIYNKEDPNYRKWELEGKISILDNGHCMPASVTKEDIHKYSFDMTISLIDGEVIDILKKSVENEIELIQEIWVPLLQNDEINGKAKPNSLSFAYCRGSENITQINYQNYKLNCYIPVQINNIFSDIIRINSFFDKIYIKQGNTVSIITAYMNVIGANNKTYISLDENNQTIICPNQPVFSIESKNYITMGLFYNETNKYTFFLTGTLSNGYYGTEDGKNVGLNETKKDITFYLVIQDNFKESDDNEVNVTCILPNRTPYLIRNYANIKCIGSKEITSNQNNNIDITLNWNLKRNNNFEELIINWPKSYDDLNKKNIYSYELTGLSIRQTNFGCHNNNFDFYVYIYDLGREPKLSFELPLSSPISTTSNCQVFDSVTLKCSINLKHKKLSKGTKVMLPDKGTQNEIFTEDGNTIIFNMNNLTEINNNHDFYVKTEETCGDYLVVGALKDMGISHNTSVALYVLVIIFICIFIVGFILYIAYNLRLRYKKGRKLTVSEESKNNSSNISANKT